MRLKLHPIYLAIVLVPVAVVLGYVGFMSLPGSKLSVTDALYSTLQLFPIQAAITQNTPWQLDVARFLAPFSLVYAAVVTAVALLREQAQALATSRVRDHVLVVGLGEVGTMVAKGLREIGWSVVALESDRHSAGISAARAVGVRVIVGGGTSSPFMWRAQVTRARHVVVLTGDDSRNLEVAAVARHTIQERGSGHATVHVAIEDVGLWRELSRLRLAELTQQVTTEYFNLVDRTAQRLLVEAERLAPASAFTHVLVEGDTPLATRVVSHLVQRALIDGIRPRIDLVSAAGGDPLARLRRDEPWCLDNGDVHVGEVDALPRSGSAALALVCLVGDDAAAITRGLVLARQLPQTQVLVAVYGERSETTLEAAGANVPTLHLISVRVETLGRELLDRSGLELMAKARHEDYVRRERARGVSEQDNASMVAWEHLPKSLKESNRRFAEALAAVIADLGGSLVPLTGPAADDGLPVDEATLDRLARGEHERWMQSLSGDGWRPTTGPKDPHQKLHPLLVPWEQLPESEQEKDRDAFRALPHMLARVGYALVVPDSSKD